MGSDIFTAVKGLTSPTLENAVFPQGRTSSTNEQIRRASAARLEQQNRNTEHALAFFKGKRLLGGNLLLGGSKPVDPFVTRSLFASVQQDEDDFFAQILRRAQERVERNQFLPSEFNPISSKQRVQRLLENAPQAREPQRYRYSSYDPVADKRRLEELQARINAILQASRSRLANILLEGALPDVSQRPRVSDLLPARLSEAKLDGSVDFRLSQRLAHLDLDPLTPSNLRLDASLRLPRPNSFAGLTATQIEDKQLELGLTAEQVAAEQKRDTAGIPTHVQVTLQGRSLNLAPGFVESQRRIDPNFQIESHRSPTGTLVLDGTPLPSRSVRGTLIHRILSYEEYQRLEYKPPTTDPNEEQIDYLSVIAFRHPDGSNAALDNRASRAAIQTIALTTPETPPAAILDTRGGVHEYNRHDISLPTESNSLFSEVELTFDDTIFGNTTATNILEAIDNGDLIIEVSQRGYNRSYSNDRELTLDREDLRERLGDLVFDNDNRVRFLFFATDLARDGVDIRLYIRRQGAPIAPALVLEGVRAKFI